MKPGHGFKVAVGSQRSRDRYHHADDRRKWPLLARVWPFYSSSKSRIRTPCPQAQYWYHINAARTAAPTTPPATNPPTSECPAAITGDQACGRAGKDRGDHGDHSGDRLVDQSPPAAKALDGKPPRWRDAGQVISELWRMVEVVSPEARDPFYVFKLFDSVLEHPVEGGEANEGERRQEYQAEGIERRADAGRGGDQPESDQPRGYRAEEDRCPAYPSADRRAPRSLEGEMLGGDERDCRRRRLICAVRPGSRVFFATHSSTSLPR